MHLDLAVDKQDTNQWRNMENQALTNLKVKISSYKAHTSIKRYSHGLYMCAFLSQVESVTTQQAQWEMEGGAEVKTKQTVRVTTAASHSKHESSEKDK